MILDYSKSEESKPYPLVWHKENDKLFRTLLIGEYEAAKEQLSRLVKIYQENEVIEKIGIEQLFFSLRGVVISVCLELGFQDTLIEIPYNNEEFTIEQLEETMEPVYQYGQQGLILPLNDYYEAYGYYTQENFEKKPEVKSLAASPDGNIYVVPRYVRSMGNELPNRVWINQVWLENLGLEMPKTTEEFEAVLKAFKENDPNGNGKNDEIPMVGAKSGWGTAVDAFLLNSFIYNDNSNRFVVENGKVSVAYNTEGWKEGLKYMNRLCESSLVSPLSYTQDEAQLKQLALNPDAALIGVIPVGSLGNIFTAEDPRLQEYYPLEPLVGPEGVQYCSYEPASNNNSFFISKDCQNPAAAFRLADLFYSEEAVLRGRFGVPEIDWTAPSEGEVGLYAEMGVEARIKPILPWGGTQNQHWSEIQATFRDGEISDGQVWSGSVDFNYLISKAVPLYIDKKPEEYLWKRIFTEEEAEEVSELETNLKTYMKESMARFIIGDMKIDSEWDAYCKELDNIGLQRYLEINQSVYDRMNQN